MTTAEEKVDDYTQTFNFVYNNEKKHRKKLFKRKLFLVQPGFKSPSISSESKYSSIHKTLNNRYYSLRQDYYKKYLPHIVEGEDEINTMFDYLKQVNKFSILTDNGEMSSENLVDNNSFMNIHS